MPGIENRQAAIKVAGPGQLELVQSCALPEIESDEVLVKVACVAVNPVDAKSADLSPTAGATSGCDLSGTIVSVGSAVQTRRLQPGTRVCGCVFGNNPDRPSNGAFAEYVAVPADLTFTLPSNMSFQTAATLGVGLATVGLALYQSLGLPMPSSPTNQREHVLVYGGGTATGTLAIQMLRLSGFVPIATCSPHSFDKVKSLGVAEAFDYRSPSCGEDIRNFTGDELAYALDCITNTDSMRICYASIGKKGGKYLALDPFSIRDHTRRSIKPNWIVAFTIFNRPVNWQKPFKREARPQDRMFAESWYAEAQKLLDGGVIEAHAYEAAAGGLGPVLDGIDRVRKGKAHGVKLVYDIATSA